MMSNTPILKFIPVTAEEITVKYYHLSPARMPMLDPQPANTNNHGFGYVPDLSRRVFQISIVVEWKGMEGHGIVNNINLNDKTPNGSPYQFFQQPEEVIPSMAVLQTSIYWPELIESALWFLNTNLRSRFETVMERITVESPPMTTTVTEAKAAFFKASGEPASAEDYDAMFHAHDDPSPSEY